MTTTELGLSLVALSEREVKPHLVSSVAEIAREECKKMYEKRLASLEETDRYVYVYVILVSRFPSFRRVFWQY